MRLQGQRKWSLLFTAKAVARSSHSHRFPMHREPQGPVVDVCMDSGSHCWRGTLKLGIYSKRKQARSFPGERPCLIPQGCTLQTLGETELPRNLAQKWSGTHILGTQAGLPSLCPGPRQLQVHRAPGSVLQRLSVHLCPAIAHARAALSHLNTIPQTSTRGKRSFLSDPLEISFSHEAFPECSSSLQRMLLLHL